MDWLLVVSAYSVVMDSSRKWEVQVFSPVEAIISIKMIIKTQAVCNRYLAQVLPLGSPFSVNFQSINIVLILARLNCNETHEPLQSGGTCYLEKK